jgi:transketolase
VAGSVWASLGGDPAGKPVENPAGGRANLWALAELPIAEPPASLLAQLARSRRLLVIEEHVAHGGAGGELCRWLMLRGLAPAAFKHLHAAGYPSGRYGSQPWHRRESGLDPAAIRAALAALEAA